MTRRIRTSEAGYTLIELIVALTILATITGAITATFLTANNANANISERIHESNDAQLTAGFWTADAQATGGVDSTTGLTDSTLGVFANGDGGCDLGGGALVIRFEWKEWASRVSTPPIHDKYTTRVANYVYKAGTAELERRTCSDAALAGTIAPSGALTLATRVKAAPTVSCLPDCSGIPQTVTITVAETNVPATTPAPGYTFTLTAAVRSGAEALPGAGNAAGAPLLALGSSTCSGGTTGLSVGGNSTVIVNGQAVINAVDVGGCTAMSVNGHITYAADGTSLLVGGTCASSGSAVCPPRTVDSTGFGDPFATLPPPAGSCAGSGNPPAGTPGIYRSAATLTGNLAPGTYVFCNTLGFSGTVTGTDVFLYFKGSGGININGNVNLSISAPRTGLYAGLLLWNDTTTAMTISGNSGANVYAGTIYSPNADVTVAGTADMYIGSIVAKRILFSGTGNTDITNGSSTPGAPTLTTATSATATRQVNLSWTVPAYTGTAGNPITGYEYRVDTGAGYGAWTAVPGGLVTSLAHTCGTSNTVASSCTYEVRAVNAQGAGSASNASTASSLADATAPTITTPANGGVAGTVSTFTGTAWSGPGDGNTITINVYAGSGCTGAPIQTFFAARAGGTWSTTSPAMTNGAKCARASQTAFNSTVGSGAAVDFTVGQVRTVTLANANGLVANGDTVSIQFAQAMNEPTLCSTWAGTGDQSIAGNNAVTVTITNGGAGNDVLTVSSTTCPFNFGSLDLGSPGWVAATTTFKGTGGNKSTIAYTGLTNTLTIGLGGVSAGAGNTTLVGLSTVVYAPAGPLQTSTAGPLVGTYSFANRRF